VSKDEVNIDWRDRVEERIGTVRNYKARLLLREMFDLCASAHGEKYFGRRRQEARKLAYETVCIAIANLQKRSIT